MLFRIQTAPEDTLPPPPPPSTIFTAFPYKVKAHVLLFLKKIVVFAIGLCKGIKKLVWAPFTAGSHNLKPSEIHRLFLYNLAILQQGIVMDSLSLSLSIQNYLTVPQNTRSYFDKNDIGEHCLNRLFCEF